MIIKRKIECKCSIVCTMVTELSPMHIMCYSWSAKCCHKSGQGRRKDFKGGVSM